MAPTTTEEEVGEVSGSRSRAERRRRQRQRQRLQLRQHTPTNRAVAAQSEAAASSQRGERKAPPERGTSEPEEEEAPVATATSPGTWHASSTEASSVVSSPMRWPSVPVVKKGPGCEILERFRDPAIEDAYQDLKMKYHAKRDGTLMARSSGFFINWDEESKVGTVLTSARLICSKNSSMDQWLGSDEYSPDATVCAHLLDKDETTVPAALLHYDRHFNIALVKVDVDSCAKIPSFTSEVTYSQDIFSLGRDGDLNLTINHGHVQFKGPTIFERHYYMYTGSMTGQSGIGGPIINFNGQVLGMANVPGVGFIPSFIILHCLDLWKKFGYIPRLHIGMKLSAVKFLDPIHVEKISRKCNVDSGLIVKEVSYGSTAEKLGVRADDIIQSINGKCIATTVELEDELMQICENHLDKGRCIGSSVDIQVGIFRMCKGSTCTISLRLNVSDDVEVFARGKYVFSARDCAWVFDDVGIDLQP